MNLFCLTCHACWHADGVALQQVDPASCPGCAIAPMCGRAVATATDPLSGGSTAAAVMGSQLWPEDACRGA